MNRNSVCITVTLCLVLAGGAQPLFAQEAKTGEGAIVGGLLGAVAGGVIGKQSHKTTQGALIGGAVGALGGAMVGSQMKSQPAATTAKSSGTSSVASLPTTATATTKVTMKQIIYWTEQGLPAGEIISRIKKSSTAFVLTADDIDYLQKQSVSQRVIEAMQEK